MLTNLFSTAFKSFLALFIVLQASFNPLTAQDLQIDSLGFETFEIEEEDTSFVMKNTS